MNIKIGGREYLVDFNPTFESNDIDGCIDYVGSTISISNNIAPDFAQETLLHEVLHGIADDAKLCEFFDESIVEKFITVMTPRLLQVLKDNQNLITKLTNPVSL